MKMVDESKDQEEEIEIMQENIKHMRFQYLWPKQNQKYYLLKLILWCTITLPPCLSNVLHFIALTEKWDNLDNNYYTEDISTIISIFGMNQMILSFIWYQKEIATLWKLLGISKTFGKPDNFEKRRQQLNHMIKLFSYYLYLALTCYNVVKVLEGRTCERRNKEQNLNEICGMIVPTWAPFDLHSAPYKQIVFGFQLIASYHVCKGTAAVSAAIFETSEYIVLKMKHLRRLLTEVFDDPKEEKRKENMDFCIKYHQHIIELQNSFNKAFRICNGVFFIMGALIFGTAANDLMKKVRINTIVHLSSMFVLFYINCHSGQSLLTESLKIPISAYKSKWYLGSLSLQKQLLVLVVRSQKGSYLEAAPIGTMTLDLFVTVMKTSYSYFTFLHQMM